MGGALLLAAGCRDEVPTLTDPARFPGAGGIHTVELVVPTEALVLSDTVFDGYTGPRTLGAMVVANRFGTAGLEARGLARFPLPEQITYTYRDTARVDSVYTVVAGEVSAVLDRAATRLEGPVDVQLWDVTESWDPVTATWAMAVDTAGDRRAWRVPGGTRGALLSSVTLEPQVEAPSDTIRWSLDSVAVNRLTGPGAHGLLVTIDGSPARIQYTGMVLAAQVRPATAPDTLVGQVVSGGPRHFVFSPEAPRNGAVWPVGGVRSARTVLRIEMPRHVPGRCPPTVANCPEIPIENVMLNQVALVLTPQPIPDGFQPLTTPRIAVRIVAEPDLGARAPLGPVIARDTVPARVFEAANDTTIALVVSPEFARRLVRSDTRAETIAITADPEGAWFGTARFARVARLRIMYTLVPEPTLP
jgi:hypothetical protein